MRQFDVIVNPKSVTLLEIETPPRIVDVRANIDGEQWLYRITRKAFQHMHDGWRERGYVHAYYHARNGGNHVAFIRVDSQKNLKSVKRSPQQMRLLDE